MLNQFAEFKSAGKAIKLYFSNGQSVEGLIMEISPEHVSVNWNGKRTVVQTAQILYFHEV
jgi:hypothetical protein